MIKPATSLAQRWRLFFGLSVGVAQSQQFWKRVVIFGAIRPLFGRNDVLERGDVDHDVIRSVGSIDGPGQEVVVAQPTSILARDLYEHVEITGIGPPCRNLHPGQREGVDLHR
jgi:hypothetical protein